MRELFRSIGRPSATTMLMILSLAHLGCSRSAPAIQQTPDVTTAIVPPSGGTVELDGVGAVTFPAGAFPSPWQVTLWATNAREARELRLRSGLWIPFEFTAPWELRINSGDAAPDTPVTISLIVPNTFLDSLPPDREPAVWAQVLQSGGMDLIDSFLWISTASFDSSSNRINAELHIAVFTDQRTPDNTFEARVVVGSARR